MDSQSSDLIFYAGIGWMLLIAAITALIFTTDMFEALFGSNHFPVEGRTILITGGSQGLGRALGKLLASKGANITIVARNEAKLASALSYIQAAAASPIQSFHYISADLTDPDAAERVLAEATRLNDGAPPDIVWANAGSAYPSLLLDTEVDILKSQMDINYFAALFLARASLKLWLANPRTTGTKVVESTEAKSEAAIYGISDEKRTRHFVITSSVAAWVGLAGYTPYAPAKAALRSLHDTLRSEMALYNGFHSKQNKNRTSKKTGGTQGEAGEEKQPLLKCAIVMPGTILSPGLDEENKVKHPVTKMLEDGDPAQTEDETAAAAVKRLERGYAIIATQGLQGSVMRGSSMMGSVRDRIVGDTFWAWLGGLAWLFVAPDMEGKVWRWGRDKGVSRDAV